MVFNSLTYLIFLFAVCLIYYSLVNKSKKLLITISSIIFYGFWHYYYIIPLIIAIISDYYIAIYLGKLQNVKLRKILLSLSVLVNLLLLCYFKYISFLVENTINLVNFFGFSLHNQIYNVVLPLGISFYTFESISYMVDVYRRKIKSENDFFIYSSFILFFPKLIAGPILRASELIPQLNRANNFDYLECLYGLKRILAGLFLKVVLADNLAPIVDKGFSQSFNSLSAIDVVTLSFLFGFQIYFDFAGYSSIAIGSARLLGIKIPENFSFPYTTHNPKEFWSKWHISLSTWVRDYIYIPINPINDNREKINLKLILNQSCVLILTWALMGLWHGANWGFVLWGIYHAIYILIYRMVNWVQFPSNNIFKVIYIFLNLFIIMLGWIFFRSQSVNDALILYLKLTILPDYFWLGMRENNYLIAFLCLVTYFLYYQYHCFIEKKIHTRIAEALNGISIAIQFLLVFIFIRPINQFIYFQF